MSALSTSPAGPWLRNLAGIHLSLGILPVLSTTIPARIDLATIRQAIGGTHRALQLLQSQLEDKPRRKLRRLAQRLVNIDHELDHLTPK